jgi:hypothetical protein
MDITNESLKSMKAKQLRRIVREAIEEVLAENTAMVITKTGMKNIPFKNPSELDALKKDPNVSSIEDTAGKKLKEGDIEEMARIAKGFRLADPNFDASQYANKRISGVSMADIIDFFRENPGAEKTALQSQFGFVRPQIANAVVNGLLDAGVLVKLGTGGEVEATPEPGEEQPETIDGPEAMFIGGGNPLAQYFDNEPNDDGSEDMNDEEEPTTGEIEPATPSSSSMSDEDYDAWMKWSDLNDRLSATKSNILKAKRGKKGGVAGDISDTSGSEIPRLTALKQSLEDKMNALVAGSKYLQNKIEKETGKAYEPIEVEPEEEDTLDEAFNKEYELRKLQYYAGIRK